MKRSLKTLALMMCLIFLFGAAAMAEDDARELATVTLYTTNDLHGVVGPSPDDGVLGLPLIAGIAASTENAVLLDAGDATQGASFATVDTGAHVIDVMNAAGYQAMAAGNHEFDYGAEALLRNAEKAQFPILSANVTLNGQPLLTPSAVVEAAGYKIGLIGLTTASTATSTNPAQLAGIAFENELDSAKAAIAAPSDDVDAIVVIAHLGDNPLATGVTSQALVEGLAPEERAKIAAVVDGHSHTVENTAVAGIPVVQTGTLDTALGVVTIQFAADGSFTAEGNVWDYAAAAAFPLSEAGLEAQARTQAAYDQCVADMEPILAEELAYTGAPIWGGYIYYDYAEPRIVETTMGDFVTDAFRHYGELFAANNGLTMPVIGLENGGGISATFPYGIVSRGDVLNAFNHGNMVDVLQVTPAQLYTALELGLTMTGQDETGLLLREKVSGSFLQVSGLTYAYDPAGEAGSKVVSVTLDDGTALARDDETTKIMVVTNNYVTTFSGLKDGEKLGELGGEDALVQDYVLLLTENGEKTLTVDKPAERIQIANDQSPETYDVVIPILSADGDDHDFSGYEFTVVIDNEETRKVVCEENALHLTVSKGTHTFYLAEATYAVPVYTNNYSGSGTVTTAQGYYQLAFTVEPGINQ